jgi:hypothetical protein
MHRFLARAQPSFERILLVESAPRKVMEETLRYLYLTKDPVQLDVLTCYDSPPDSFDFDRGVVYSVNDPEARENRGKFIRGLLAPSYTILGVMCTGTPILQKWKWVLAFRTSARLVVVNEEARYFGLDVWNLKTARLMLLKRLNPFADSAFGSLAEAGAASLADILLVPFTVAYLLLCTAAIHLRRQRKVRNPATS